MSTPVELSRAYAWVRPPVLVERDPTTVQIGAEPADSLVLRHAPPGAVSVLERLDGSRPLAELIPAPDANPAAWAEVAAVLVEAGLVCAATEAGAGPVAAGLPPAEAGHLIQRFGRSLARQLALARRDALVVIHDGGRDAEPAGGAAPRGAEVLAAAIEDLLASSGIGHLHRPGAFRAAPAASRRDPATASGVAATDRPGERGGGTGHLPRRDRPAGHQLPVIAVLTGAAAGDLALAATLTLARVPHLAVSVTDRRAVVGPLVLPGRSSCLWCVHRHRVDADAAWPAVVLATRRAAPPASAVVRSHAATLAAHQVLTFVDGLAPPAGVDGTLEWSPDGVATRRRTWAPHPDCACGAGAGG